MKLPSKFIVTGDWHLRSQLPRCRKDENWIDTQKKALNQICIFAIDKKCDIMVTGDIFDSQSTTSFEIIQLVQNMAKKLKKYNLGLYVIFGNHDLLYHSSGNIKKSAVGILLQTENIFPISVFENVSAPNFDEEDINCEYMFKHVLCFPDMKSLPPNVDAFTAKELLEKFDKCNYLFLGDMHKNFHYEKNGRHVVNPGCMLRQAVDFKDYQSGFYFIDTDKNIVDFQLIIDDEKFIDDSYILREKEKEERIQAFADKIGEVESVSLDYIENVKSAMMTSKLSEELKETINELVGI